MSQARTGWQQQCLHLPVGQFAVDVGLLQLVLVVPDGTHAFHYAATTFLQAEIDGQTLVFLNRHATVVGIDGLYGRHAVGRRCQVGLVDIVAHHAYYDLAEYAQRALHHVVVAHGEGIEASYYDCASHCLFFTFAIFLFLSVRLQRYK